MEKIDQRILDEFATLKYCPCCGLEKTLSIETPKRFYLAKGKMINCKQYVYQCNSCGEQFTSTTSDSISFEKFFK